MLQFGKNDLFVSPKGNDAWSGRLPEPNAEGTDGPLATLAGARDRIRRRKGLTRLTNEPPITAGMDGPCTVWLRGGRYPLTEAVRFEPQDSAPVTYAAYPGERPILDGGVRIEGWQETRVNGVKAWVAELPEVAQGKWAFRELFVNGQRRPRPRLPRQGLYRMAAVPGMPLPARWGKGGYTQFVAAEGEGCPFRNLNDVEVVYVHFWIEERSPIASYDPATRLVTMTRPSRAPLVGSFGSQLADYYYDNVLEALSEPGEWYLDRAEGKLYYIPLPGEDPATTEVYAPRALQLLALVGNPDEGKFVEFLRFRGLTFRHTDWRQPFADGAEYIGPSGDPTKFYSRRHFRGNMASAGQAASDVPGVIFMEAARHCAIEDCLIEHIGWYGVEIADACWGIRLVGNTIRDMGAGGVKVNGADAMDPPHRRTGNHRITDNEIHAGGRIFHCAVGVLVMNAHSNVISHNHIYDLYYSGISCGWVWGYHENVARDNLIEKNHIHDLGQGLLSDMGGIYTLGVQPGTVLRGNVIHDINMAHYGAWCIYPDEGSAHLLIENNICYRTNDNIFHQHYGRENIVRNNIFVYGDRALIAHGRADTWHRGFTLERNIIVSKGSPMFAGGYGVRLEQRNHGSDLNLYWDVTGKPLTFSDRTQTIGWEEWRKLGHDWHSVIADPKFRDPEHDDFTLEPDSPAWALGFKLIDTSDVGPRPPEQRD